MHNRQRIAPSQKYPATLGLDLGESHYFPNPFKQLGQAKPRSGGRQRGGPARAPHSKARRSPWRRPAASLAGQRRAGRHCPLLPAFPLGGGIRGSEQAGRARREREGERVGEREGSCGFPLRSRSQAAMPLGWWPVFLNVYFIGLEQAKHGLLKTATCQLPPLNCLPRKHRGGVVIGVERIGDPPPLGRGPHQERKEVLVVLVVLGDLFEPGRRTRRFSSGPGSYRLEDRNCSS
jgi:hypothetical protein